MNNNVKSQILIGGAVVVRDIKGKEEWFLIKSSKDSTEWEMPKTVVRKGESSVRAVLRIMGEKGAMTVKVLEEAGRSGGATTVADKTVPQRQIYYIMLMKATSGDPVGFDESVWAEYASAVKKLSSKREVQMLAQGRELYKEWKKAREKRRKLQQEQEEEEPEEL